MEKFKEIVKGIDIFGYPVVLNFNNSGNSHNTIPGGIISVFVYLGLIVYTLVLINRVDNREFDILTAVTKPAIPETFEKRSYKEMDFNILTYLY